MTTNTAMLWGGHKDRTRVDLGQDLPDVLWFEGLEFELERDDKGQPIKDYNTYRYRYAWWRSPEYLRLQNSPSPDYLRADERLVPRSWQS